MHRIVRSTNIRGFDRQIRHLFVPAESAISEFERGTQVGWMHSTWSGQRTAFGEIPTIATISDELCFARDDLNVVIAHRVFGKISLSKKRQTFLGDTLGTPFAQDCLEQEIRRCAREAAPRYIHVFETISGITRTFSRLLLPRAAFEGGVSDVIVFERTLVNTPEPANMM